MTKLVKVKSSKDGSNRRDNFDNATYPIGRMPKVPHVYKMSHSAGTNKDAETPNDPGKFELNFFDQKIESNGNSDVSNTDEKIRKRMNR